MLSVKAIFEWGCTAADSPFFGLLPHIELTHPQTNVCIFLHFMPFIQKPPEINVCEQREGC